MRRRLKHVAFGAVLFITTVLLCELTLQIAALLLARSGTTPFRLVPLEVKDPVLGVRGNPSYPSHDRRGFRNPSVPKQALIITLGDSQTYGVGVVPEEAWPKQLEKIHHATTYSMAFGSYGPTHFLLLLEEAIALDPKLVIAAFYSGNDLYDSYGLVHKRGRLPELLTTRADILRRIAEADKLEPIGEKISSLFRSALLWNEKPPPLPQSTLDRLVSQYELIRLGREVIRLFKNAENSDLHDPRQFDEAYWETVREQSSEKSGHRVIFQSGVLRTVFTPRYRLGGVDLRDPRIEEGLQIALGAIERINTRLKSVDIPLLVLLIPTKELVFQPLVAVNATPTVEAYRILIENEEEIWRRTKTTLNKLGIRYLDTLPALRTLVNKDIQPYPVSWDGHMNAIGHRVVANLVQSRISGFVVSNRSMNY